MQGFTAEEDGNLTVFIDNSDTEPVYFDELELRVERTPTLVITQEHHYYPFGMNMSGIERDGELKYQFNGMIEKEEAFGLELYETPFRSYDAQLGRFWQVEPLADIYVGVNMYQFAYNNPVSFNDPSGLRADPPRPYYNPFEAIGIRPMHQGNRGFPLYGDRGSRETGIDLSDLRAGDPIGATRLVKDLQDFTGLASLHINKKGFLDYDRGYWWGRLLGFNKIKNPSAIARRELIRAIKSRTVTEVLNNYHGASKTGMGIGTKVIGGTNTILFDRWQIEEGVFGGASSGIKNKNLQRTWGLAAFFFHEEKHTLKGGELKDNYTDNYVGETVEFINKIREQLNLPLRMTYSELYRVKYIHVSEGVTVPEGFNYFPFDLKSLNILKKDDNDAIPNKNLLFFVIPSEYIPGGME